MTRRFHAFSLALVFSCAVILAMPGCKDDGPRPALSAADNALLRAKADGKIETIVRENLPSHFAGVVVFRSDVFLFQSDMLDRANISVLNVSGNTAILLLNSADLPPLLKHDAVKKVFYLCRQAALPRLDDLFEMDMLRRFGQGKEDERVAIFVRFFEQPSGKDEAIMKAAGFEVISRQGFGWTVAGPLRGIQRLLESDGIIYYEMASNPPGIPLPKENILR